MILDLEKRLIVNWLKVIKRWRLRKRDKNGENAKLKFKNYREIGRIKSFNSKNQPDEGHDYQLSDFVASTKVALKQIEDGGF